MRILAPFLADPRLPFLAVGLVALATLVVLLLLRRRRRAARGVTVRVRALATRGLPAAEIARRTGLSRDAVALALRIGGAAAPRKVPPAAARTAGRFAPRRPAAPAEGFSQVLARTQLTQDAAGGSKTAYPLPSPVARSHYGTRTRNARWASSTA